MTSGTNVFKGIVHGKVIELEQEAGLPDGQPVSVTLWPSLARGDGLRRAFGSWAAEARELDQFLDQLRLDRKHHRSDPAA